MLKQIFMSNKGRISFSYLVLAAENVTFAMCPWLFGKAVDGLVADDYEAFRFYMLVISVAIIVGSFRRVADTRIFGRIWEKVTTGIIVEMIDKGSDKNKTMVAAGLAPQYVNFLEWHLPNGMRGLIYCAVSLTMLVTSTTGPGIWMVVFAVSVLISADFVARKQAEHEGHRIDACEDTTRGINESDSDLVVTAYSKRIHHYIKKSDWEAAGWCFSDVLSIAAEALVVISLVKSGATVGVILATTVYVGRLFGSMNTLTFFISMCRDIGITGRKIEEARSATPE